METTQINITNQQQNTSQTQQKIKSNNQSNINHYIGNNHLYNSTQYDKMQYTIKNYGHRRNYPFFQNQTITRGPPCEVYYIQNRNDDCCCQCIQQCNCLQPRIVGERLVGINQRYLPETVVSIKEYQGQKKEQPVRETCHRPRPQQQPIYHYPQQQQIQLIKEEKQRGLKHYKSDTDFSKYRINETYTKSKMFNIPYSEHKSHYEEIKYNTKNNNDQFRITIDTNKKNKSCCHITGLGSHSSYLNNNNTTQVYQSQQNKINSIQRSSFRCIC